MTVIIAILSVYLLNIALATSMAMSEARAHNVEATFRNIVDWCVHRSINPPQKLPEAKVDKHALYTMTRDCFWIVAFLFIYTVSDYPNKFIFASFNCLAMLLTFRAMHGFVYYHYYHKLDKNTYPDGWQTDGQGKTSDTDALIGDSFMSRVYLFLGGLLIVLFQLFL